MMKCGIDLKDAAGNAYWRLGCKFACCITPFSGGSNASGDSDKYQQALTDTAREEDTRRLDSSDDDEGPTPHTQWLVQLSINDPVQYAAYVKDHSEKRKRAQGASSSRMFNMDSPLSPPKPLNKRFRRMEDDGETA